MEKATREPVKVTPPMKVPRKMAVLRTESRCCDSTRWFATQVMTAAAPTSEWKSATICGRSVTSIRFAMIAPIDPPVGIIHISMYLDYFGLDYYYN